MSVKLRLRRQGRKGVPYYHIVAADSRTTRDGKFLEKVGTYNPISNPAIIDVDIDIAIKWLRNGAQPTNTVRAILRYTGATLKYALTVQGKSQEEIDRIFDKWKAEKVAKVDAKIGGIASSAQKNALDKLAAETKVREKRAAAIVAKNTPAPAPAPEPVAAEEAADESASNEE